MRRDASGRLDVHRLTHTILTLLLFTAVCSWVYGTTVVQDKYLAWSDLYEYFLPGFLSPYVNWSTNEFGGVPTFADFSEPTAYPVFILFSKIFHSWIAYVIFAHVLASFGTYLYVCVVTRSRAAGVIAGLGFVLSEAMLKRLSHMTTIHTIAWMPWVFICIERLLATGNGRWVGLGALSLAMVIIAGHPQPAMYACLAAVAYAVIGGRCERKPRRFWYQTAALFTLGGMLTLIKVLPFAELLQSLSRDRISFGHFIAYANTPIQMWSMLFPTVLHEGRESPLYVELGLTLFAMLAVTRVRTDWRIAFWLATVAIGILFGLGDHTPFARLAYDYLPLYDKFRVASRHLILSCFGLAILSGFGLQAALQVSLSIRRRVSVLLVFTIIFGTGLLVMMHPPEGLQFEVRDRLIVWAEHGFPPILSNEVWTQTVIAAVTVLLSAGIMFARRKLPWVALLIALVFIDGLNGQPFRVSTLGLDSVVMPVAAARPSVHAQRLAHETAPLHQRLLAIGATSTDALVPAVWARIWSIPIAGGYGPMLFDRWSRLGTMGRNGGVTNRVLASSDVALDVMAVNTIMVRPSDIESSGTVEAGGSIWEKQPLDISIGRPDCGYQYSRTISLPLPPGIDLSEVHLAMYLRCAEDTPQGVQVGAITVVTAEGARISKPLRAGIEIADSSLSDPSIRERARHQATPPFPDPDASTDLRSLVTLTLSAPTPATRLEVTASSIGWLTVRRLTLRDAQGHMLPQAMGPLFLSDSSRWREVRRIRTSRESDRTSDEDARGEEEFRIYQNTRALPRVWLASQVRVLKPEDVLAAFRWGQLPDGTPFNPSTTALIDTDSTPPAERAFAQGTGDVTIEEVTNGRMSTTVTSSAGGFLVFSENFYHGWRAEVDGIRARIYRADYALQGIEVPAGTHHVVFTFRPITMYIGGACSLLALVAVGILVTSRQR